MRRLGGLVEVGLLVVERVGLALGLRLRLLLLALLAPPLLRPQLVAVLPRRQRRRWHSEGNQLLIICVPVLSHR